MGNPASSLQKAIHSLVSVLPISLRLFHHRHMSWIAQHSGMTEIIYTEQAQTLDVVTLKKNLVAVGVVLVIVGLVLVVLMAGRYEVRAENRSIEKKNGYGSYAYVNKLNAGDEFIAEWTCTQPKGELRMVLITESWFNRWTSGQDIPKSELLADSSGHQGKLTYSVRAEGTYYLVLLPEASTASWPFSVAVKLESRSGGGAGWLLGLAVMAGGVIVLVIGFVKKGVAQPMAPSPPQVQQVAPAMTGPQYCVNCGAQLPSHAAFCPECGTARNPT